MTTVIAAVKVSASISRILNQIKQQIKTKNKCEFKLAGLYDGLWDAVGNYDEFRRILKEEINFSETQIETALSLADLYTDISNEKIWEILGQAGLRDLQKLNKNDYRRVINTIVARERNREVTRREIVTLIHDCQSYPKSKPTKLKAEHEGLGRFVISLLEEGSITIDQIPATQSILGTKINLRTKFTEFARNIQ